MIETFLILLAFFIRILPRLLRKYKTDADTWYHISASVLIYRNKYCIPTRNKNYILDSKYDYPYLAHWFFALIARNNIVRYERFISPLIDTLYILGGLYYFTFLLDFYSIEDSHQKVISFLILITFSPTMLKISTGPRVYSFSPRIFGELQVFVYLGSMHLFILTEGYLYFFVSMFFGGIALNTSKFGMQVILLFSLNLSVLMPSFLPLLLLFSSFLVSILLSNGRYLNILKQHLNHLYNYARYSQFNHKSLLNRNKLGQYWKFFKYIYKGKLKEAFIIFIADLTFFNVFYKNLDVIVGLVFITLFSNILVDDFIKSLFIGALITFAITSFRPFLFLGESDRYLEYIVVFVTVLLSMSLSFKWLIFLTSIYIIYYILTLLLYLKLTDDFGFDFLDAMQYVNLKIKNKKSYIVHGIFNIYINYPLSVLTNIKSLAIDANYGSVIMEDKKLMPINSVYTNDFDYLYNEYGVNIIIANKKYLNQDIKYDFNKFNLFYENKQYVVYVRKEI